MDSNDNVQPSIIANKEETNENLNLLSKQFIRENAANRSAFKMNLHSKDPYAFEGDVGLNSSYIRTSSSNYGNISPYEGSSQDTLDIEFDTSGSRTYTSRSYQQRLQTNDNVAKDEKEKSILKSINQNYNQTGLNRNVNRNDKKISPLQHLLLFSEDMRISKILRRLLSENNTTNALELCKKLEVAVRTQANTPYICRAFENLADSIITVLKIGPSQCLEKVAIIFGLMGYINRSDFLVYKNYITKTYNSNKAIQKYLMLALKTTFSCDAVNMDLVIYSDRVLIQLKEYLEDADIADTFIAVTKAIVEFSKNYKRCFEKHFVDIVDIVVGWHLEVEQTQLLKMHCSFLLQSFSHFFLRELDFTFGLLGQFLEDIALFGDVVCSAITSEVGIKRKSPPPEVSIGSFVGAFNTIIKSLANKQDFVAFTLGQNLLSQAVDTISKAAKRSFIIFAHFETVISVNDFFCLVVRNTSCDLLILNEIKEIIRLQISHLSSFNEQQIASLLFLILAIIRELRTSIPNDFVTTVLHVNSNNLIRTKLTRNEKNFKLLTKIYHEILMLKNVPLLQEAYRHIVFDMGRTIAAIDNSETNNVYTVIQAECVLNFYLSALSILATQTSSIIGMYALDPSILELLIIKCKAAQMKVWGPHPVLHSALLSLLSTHCQKNHNYRLSSRLINDNLFSKLSLDDSSTSPTSENFSHILKFFAEILIEGEKLSEYNLKLLLSWLTTLLQECKENAEILHNHSYFIQICCFICTASLKCPFECAQCIEIIQRYEAINGKVLHDIRDMCIYHLSSISKHQRDIYTKIFARLPLRISLKTISNMHSPVSGKFSLLESRYKELQQSYIFTAHAGNLRDKYFKIFMEQIAFKSAGNFSETLLKNVLTKCWASQTQDRHIEYYKASLKNINMLLSWIQWESARYCVRNKLRTTLGKPQDTFLHIESTIMQYARILAMKTDKFEQPENFCIVAVQRNARILLGLLECLEKQIYNAAEGTAFAIVSPEKPAKTFFRINSSTCKEWFNRIRTAVNLLALHSMEPEMVIRYCEVMLKTFIESDRHNEGLIDNTVMSLVWALMRCDEADTLQGLYIWINSRIPNRYLWIRYAADQAACRKEVAAEGYINVLADNKIDSYIKEFITDQLHECLLYTNQWKELREITVVRNDAKRETIPIGPVYSTSQVDALEKLYCQFTSPNITIAELISWPQAITNDDVNSFSYYKVLQSIESTWVTNLVTNCSGQSFFNSEEFLKHGLQECVSRSRLSDHLSEFIILNHVYIKLLEGETTNTFQCEGNISQSTILLKCLRWAQLFEQYRGYDINYSMCLDVAHRARIEGNAKLCQSVLNQFFVQKGFKEPMSELLTKLEDNIFIMELENSDILRGISELSKCIYAIPDRQNEAIALTAACCLHIIDQEPDYKLTYYPEITAKMLLTLSEWVLQRGYCVAGNATNDHLIRLLDRIPNISGHPDHNYNDMIPLTDMAVGKLIQASVLQCNTTGKTWSAFGNWCYRWGKKLVEANSIDNSQKAGLSTRDIEAIKELVTFSGKQEENGQDSIEDIVWVLNKHQVTITDDDEEIDANETSTTEIIENQLRNLDLLRLTPASTIAAIVQIWRQAHKSIYVYYEIAAESYFKYLSIQTSSEVSGGDSSLVTATLRLLRLVVKHAFGLQEVLEKGLSMTPTRPWKVIIPQLFSRLNHHESYVRKRVSELLCRVAEDSPHLIIFPAVVGAVEEHTKDNKNSEKNSLTSCFNSLLLTLSNQTPCTVLQVQLLVRELKRVSLLWDEFWIHSLAQVYSEYLPIFNAFESEAKKCYETQYETLNKKYTLLMSYIINDICKFSDVTSKLAETNYERIFQQKYQNVIKATIDELRKPLNSSKINESWIKIKQIYTILQQRAQRNVHASLKMSDISPALSTMKDTAICMPGVETGVQQPVYIRAVDMFVYILPTKTKPKKIAFLGSDGRKYTYLFKGLEDLHLDERIMQFLSISNSMMSRSNDSITNTYRALHYSVIPLGSQSGLISWVDGVVPLFAIYKKWQQREAPLKDISGVIKRPSELFYNKLTPLLAEQNIKITENRKLWPHSTLRKVLEELTKETPSDLFSKELWCHSNSSAGWRSSVRNYSLSMAVMSVIGYVIGLGDRHLDNILIKPTTGEILHIDYNVCFEKGKTLRVPERVPFRMTPNLEEALGITGIEGAFRIGCEHVLKTLRRERETLLTLLEAFVYDPLVDWAVGDDGTTTSNYFTSAHNAASDIAAVKIITHEKENYKQNRSSGNFSSLKKKYDSETTKSTIGLRFDSLKPYLIQYRDDIVVKFLEITSCLTEIQQINTEIPNAKLECDNITKQLALIREVKALGSAMSSHSLNSISQRYETYKNVEKNFNCKKQSLARYYEDLKFNVDLYSKSIVGFSYEKHLMSLQIRLQENQALSIENEFAIVRELLEKSGQCVLYEKADFARKEMDNTLVQQSMVATLSLDTLIQYSKVMQFYPRSSLHDNRLIKYLGCYEQLLDSKNDLIDLKNVSKQCLSASDSLDNREMIIQYAQKIKQIWLELNFDLRKSIKYLNEQSGQVITVVDSAYNGLRTFSNEMESDNPLHMLQQAMLETLAKTNESFITFEETSLSASPNSDTFILDQQFDYIEMVLKMTDAVMLSQNQNIYHVINALRIALQSVRHLQMAFHTRIPSKIVQLFQMNDDSEMLELLERLIEKKNEQEEFRLLLLNIERPEIMELINEIETIFDDCTKNLSALRHLMTDVWILIQDPRVKKLRPRVFDNNSTPFFDTPNKFDLISKLFTIAKTFSNSLQESDVESVYDVRRLSDPITHYINQLQLTTLIGLTSAVAVDLHKNLNETFQLTTLANIESFTTSKALCQNLFVALQHNCIAEHLKRQIVNKTEWLDHYTLVASAHYWLNERYFVHNSQIDGHIIHKETILSNLQNGKQSLSVWKITMEKIQAEIDENTASVGQQIQWMLAADPTLESVCKAFNSIVEKQTDKYQMHAAVAKDIMELMSVVMEFELFQKNSLEATHNMRETDSIFLNVITEWSETFKAKNELSDIITSTERSIVQLLDPEGSIDQCWIDNISGLLDEIAYATHLKIANYERTQHNLKEQIITTVQNVQVLAGTQLRTDIRHLIKMLFKSEFGTVGCASVIYENDRLSQARQIQVDFKQFFAELNDICLKLTMRDFCSQTILGLLEEINNIVVSFENNHTKLITLIASCSQIFGEGRNRFPPTVHQSALGTATDKKASQREQKRNAYAVSVWKRIRMKLEGRDPDPNRRSVISEQVDFMILEATNPDNLAVLYEGWTPWV